MELKQRLSSKALDFLEKDQLVAIDGSSTNLQFAKSIPNNLKLTVLTNSYSIAHACSMKEQVDVIVLGGTLLKESMTNVGEIAASQAALYHPDQRLTAPKAPAHRRQRQSAKAVPEFVHYHRFEHPLKLNTVSRYHVCGIEAFTTLITDSDVSGEMAVDYRNKGLDFI